MRSEFFLLANGSATQRSSATLSGTTGRQKEKGASSLFLSRAALRLLPEQIHAARFLVKYELV